MSSLFFFESPVGPRDLHSFPTRRSSDLSICPTAPASSCCASSGPPRPPARFPSSSSPPRPSASPRMRDRKSTRLNSSHPSTSYAVFCLKKKNTTPLPRIHHYSYRPVLLT